MTLSKEKFEHILAYAKQQQKLGVHHCNILPDDMVAIMEMAAGKLERRERDKQEPVAWRKFVPCEWNSTLDSYEYYGVPGKPGSREPLYAAPAGLINRLDTLLNGEEATGNKTDDDIYKDVSSLLEHALYLAERAKACRAAMLQSFGKSEQLNSPAVPDGWVMVPIDPTWSMLSADGCSKHHGGQECSHHENRKRIWRAMLAAAPKQETN